MTESDEQRRLLLEDYCEIGVVPLLHFAYNVSAYHVCLIQVRSPTITNRRMEHVSNFLRRPDKTRGDTLTFSRSSTSVNKQRRTLRESARLARKAFGTITLVLAAHFLRDVNEPMALTASLVWFAPLYGF